MEFLIEKFYTIQQLLDTIENRPNNKVMKNSHSSTSGDYEFTKTVAIKGLPCFEQKLLTRDIFEKVNEGEAIPVEYISSIAKLYINLAISKKENKEIQKYYDVILFNRNIHLHHP